MAAGLPMAARPMIRSLGVGSSVSILGAIATALLPVPLIFIKVGLSLRKRSKFAPVSDD